jgi:hypothetical protein
MLLLFWEYTFIYPHIHIPYPLRKCSTPTLGEATQKYSLCLYSTSPIKLQLFQLILPTTISALKGFTIKKREKRKERGQKSQKKRKTTKSLFSKLGKYFIPKEQL